MVSKNRSSCQVEPLEGRQMLSVTPANGRELGTGTWDAVQALKAAGSSLGQYCAAEAHPGGCAADVQAFLQPPGRV
jgi:hypothetical protein